MSWVTQPVTRVSNAVGERFYTGSKHHRLPEGALEPAEKYTGKTQLPTQRGSDLAQSEWILEFAVRLTEAGFTDEQVALIVDLTRTALDAVG